MSSRRDAHYLDEIRAIAHDLRQPAAAISALVAAARLHPGIAPEVGEYLDGIGREARAISRLCRTFVERASTTSFRLDELVADAVERARLVFATEIYTALQPVVLSGEEMVWQRMVGNLLENACRAAGARGTVKVEVDLGDAGIVIEVADSGPGFGNAEAGLAGAGFGIVVRGTERHGGHVEIGRSTLGGAAVRVVIPKSSPAVARRVV
jgi:signal transduction histidine kinase